MYRRASLVLVVIVAGLGLKARTGAPPSYAFPSHAPAGKALVLEPFQTQLVLPPDAGQIEADALKAAGYDVTILRNDQVTVQVMKTIPQYNVVYIHTHSDPIQGGDGVVATGQVYNGDPSLSSLEQDGSVTSGPVSVGNGQFTKEKYYLITSTFVRKHLGLFPDHSIVFINGCGLLKAPVFYTALQAKNVGVMISWDNEATNFDNYLSGAAFFNLMAQGMNVNDAISAELQAGYGVSKPAGGDRAQLGYLGDGKITLAEANQPAPPTGTPVPGTATPVSATATAVKPTSTPAPTATTTSVPGPALTVEVTQRVVPGKRQTIRITSSPDTIIHIKIAFPNGDHRSATTATDANGVATYVFRQHPSQITFGQVFATVTIEALKDGGTSTKTVKYRIGWSAIDVAVQPREQAVGNPVQIWVHTRAHVSVNLRLRFPTGGAATHLDSKTGSAGWAHLTYKVGRSLKKGTDRTVFVRAKVHLGVKDYFGYSSFTIR